MRAKLVIALILGSIATTSLAIPGQVYCALLEGQGQDSQLTVAARARLSDLLGTVVSNPHVFYLQKKGQIWPFVFNSYGSTHFLPWKTCVTIGENGRNIDVVAHELMHAEIASRVGYFSRLIAVPTWFDEGLAMQVDYREKYGYPGVAIERPVPNLEALSTGRLFFVSDDAQLTAHYTMSKHKVSLWLDEVRKDSLPGLLEDLSEHRDFERIWPNES